MKTHTELLMWKKLASESTLFAQNHWISLYSHAKIGIYTWEDGSPHDPQTYVGDNRCKEVLIDGTIASKICDTAYIPICQGNFFLCKILHKK